MRVLFAVLSLAAVPFLSSDQDPTLVAFLALTPGTTLLDLGLLGGIILLSTPLLRPLLRLVPEGTAFRLFFGIITQTKVERA